MPEPGAVKTRPQRRRLPQRTCVSCGSTTAKRELVRLVRTPEGGLAIDDTGKRPGRGAYLCRNPDCWERALKRSALDNALRTKLPADASQLLRNYAAERLGTVTG